MNSECLDDRQITHLICVRLKHLQYNFLGVAGILLIADELQNDTSVGQPMMQDSMGH